MLPFFIYVSFLRYICVIMRVFTYSHFVECKSLNIHNSSLYERMWSASLTNNNPAAICHNCAKRIFRGRRTASSQASKNHDINLCKKGHERNSESMSSRYGGRSPETKRQNGFPFRAFSLFHNRFLRGHAPMAQTHTHSHRKNPQLGNTRAVFTNLQARLRLTHGTDFRHSLGPYTRPRAFPRRRRDRRSTRNTGDAMPLDPNCVLAHRLLPDGRRAGFLSCLRDPLNRLPRQPTLVSLRSALPIFSAALLKDR